MCTHESVLRICLAMMLAVLWQCDDTTEKVCLVEGVEHDVGELFVVECSTCSCNKNGEITCVDDECTCEAFDNIYKEGDVFWADDACNTCICVKGSSVSSAQHVQCSQRNCPCSGEEWFREYIHYTKAECRDDYTIKSKCRQGSRVWEFKNECGCGCEQSPLCPERIGHPEQEVWVDETTCPYSKEKEVE